MVRLLACALLLCARPLMAQVDAVLQLHGQDAEYRVSNPTTRALQVTVTIFRDSTLRDSVPARISPQSFLLQVGTSQVVRIRLRTKMEAGAGYRLATTFLPTEAADPPRATMRLTLATRMIVRVKAGP